MAGPATLIEGLVLGARGRAVAGARVGWVSGPVPLPDVMLLTDAQGRFRLAAPVPGTYRLSCNDDAEGSASVELQASGKPLTLTLRLVRPR